MITFLIIVGAVLLLAGIVLAFSVMFAPEGHEDERGFHATASETPFWETAKLGNAPRGSSGVPR